EYRAADGAGRGDKRLDAARLVVLVQAGNAYYAGESAGRRVVQQDVRRISVQQQIEVRGRIPVATLVGHFLEGVTLPPGLRLKAHPTDHAVARELQPIVGQPAERSVRVVGGH